ncbi:hypothetical protein [Pseudomonas sp. FEN]|nr:hypothetical protein [Pseudomonas sp. FEN]
MHSPGGCPRRRRTHNRASLCNARPQNNPWRCWRRIAGRE